MVGIVRFTGKSFKRWAPLLSTVILMASPAMAASGGHGAAHAPSVLDTLPLWPNFLIFAAIFYLLIRKPVSQGWESRRSKIQTAVEAGQKELEAAQAKLGEVQKRISRVADEIGEIQREISSDTTNERNHILENARARAARIRAQADTSIESERKATEGAVRRELAEHVIEKATTRLRQELSADTDQALRDSALGGLRQLLQ